MGVVYLAWRVGLDRPVAIKMMLAGAHATPEDLSRFEHEIQTIARLRHPGIVQVYDVGLHEGLPYCALEYLDGGSLKDHLQGQPVKTSKAAALLGVLARAVHAAHQAGIVHRDLKPANILFAASPSSGVGAPGDDVARRGDRSWQPSDARLTDFGVAKRLGTGAGVTGTGHVIGTPAYMAPEQARGQSREVGVGADVYSLGAILYEMLAGRPPFTETATADALLEVIHHDPIPPSRLTVAVPRDLETICLKCLAKEPGRRYPTAMALADDLDRFLQGRPIAARPAGWAEVAWRWARRNPAVAGLLVALALVILLAFAGVTWQWRVAVVAEAAKEKEADKATFEAAQANAARLTAETERRAKEAEAAEAIAARLAAEMERRAKETEAARATEALKTADAERRQAETNLAYNQVSQAYLLWERNEVLRARQLLQAVPEKERGWEWHYLHRLNASHLSSKMTPGWAQRVAVSPDGRWAVVASGAPATPSNPHLPLLLVRYELPALIPQPQALAGCITPLHHFAFTPDGRLATLDGRHTVRVFEERNSRLTVAWEQPLPPGASRGWLSPDGRWLARTDADHAVRLWDVAAGKAGPVLAGHTSPVGSVAFATDGGLLASADAQENVRVWDLATGRERHRLSQAGSRVGLSPDGKWLAAVRTGAELEVFRTDTAKSAWAMKPSRLGLDFEGGPVFSPDGRWLALLGSHCPPRVWETATGQGGHFLRGHEGHVRPVTALTFTPDSQRAATTGTDHTIRLWDPFTGEPQRIYRGRSAGVLDHACTPDGRSLLAVSGGPDLGDCGVKNWDLTRDQQALRLPPLVQPDSRGEFQSLVAFRPDGSLLAGYSPHGLAAWDLSGARRQDWRFATTQDRWIEWHGLAASADGQFVAGRTGEEQQVTRLHLPTRQTRRWAAGEPLRTLALSPNGRLVAAGTRGGRLLLWDAEADQVLWGKDIGPIFRLVFSPDGRQLAIAGNGVAWVDVETGALHRAPGDSVGENTCMVGLAFQVDGPMLAASVEFPGEIRLYDTSQVKLVRRWSVPRILGDLAMHPKGDRLAAASREGFVTLYDPRTGQEVLTLQALTGRELDLAFPPRVAFSPDGLRLAANDYKGGLWVWEADAPGLSQEALNAARRQVVAGSAYDFHLRTAALCQGENRLEACRFHLAQLRRLPAPAGPAPLDLGDLLARTEDWSAAASAYRRWLQEQTQARWLTDWPEPVERYALALLLAGDQAGYRQVCGQLYQTNKDAEPAATTALARICAWGGGLEPAAVLELASRRLAVQPKEAETYLVLGLACARAGQYEQAQAALEKARRVGKNQPRIEATARLGLALVSHGCGQSKEALEHLQAVRGMADSIEGPRNVSNPCLSEWLAFRAMSEEVGRVLRTPVRKN
jgi:eukaryotic-like serine/threonine-protein kinase